MADKREHGEKSEVSQEEARGREAARGGGKKSRKEASREAVRELNDSLGQAVEGVADARDRLDRLEMQVEDLVSHVNSQGEEVFNSIESYEDKQRLGNETLKGEMLQLREEFSKLVEGLRAEVTGKLEELREEFNSAKGDIALCKAAAAAGTWGANVGIAKSRVEAPKPKEFSGKRDAKELDNYFWHMERYFEGIGLRDEQDKVSTATMYLSDSAISWWRRKHAEIREGHCSISSWDELKQELKRQFYPENVAYEARRRIRSLRQTESIAEYVAEFSDLMLQVSNMSDDDLLFDFMEGLQPWAERELRRRGVKDIREALTVAETLVDYHEDQHRFKGDNWSKGGSKESSSPSRERSWKRFHKREPAKPKGGCFICDSPEHWSKDCPKKNVLSAMIERERKAMAEKEEEGQQPTERRIGAMQFFNAMKVEEIPPKPEHSSLMVLLARVNGEGAKVMVDTGATSSFIQTRVAKRLGLDVEGDDSRRLVTPTGELHTIDGVVRGVELKIGEWRGVVDLIAAQYSGHDIVFGMDILKAHKMVLVPWSNMVFVNNKGSSPAKATQGSDSHHQGRARIEGEKPRVQPSWSRQEARGELTTVAAHRGDRAKTEGVRHEARGELTAAAARRGDRAKTERVRNDARGEQGSKQNRKRANRGRRRKRRTAHSQQGDNEGVDSQRRDNEDVDSQRGRNEGVA